MRFGLAPAPVADVVWMAAMPLLLPLLAAAGEDAFDLMDEVDAGTAQLWIGHEAEAIKLAMVTRIRGATLVGDHCAAIDTPDWKLVQDTIEAAARSQGCTGIEIDGRPGWERVFEGFKRVRVTLRKEL